MIWVTSTNHCSRGSTPYIPYVDLDDAAIMHQLLTHMILMNLILNIYNKASKPENPNLVVYTEPSKSPIPLDLSKIQLKGWTLPY